MADSGVGSSAANSSYQAETLKDLLADYMAAIAQAGNNQVRIDKAGRDFKVGIDRLAAQEKISDGFAKLFDERLGLTTELAKAFQSLGKSAADGSIANDNHAWQNIIQLLQKGEMANFELDMSYQEGQSGIVRLAGMISMVCRFFGKDDWAGYIDQKANEWKATNNVEMGTSSLAQKLGTMIPALVGASQAVSNATQQGQNVLTQQGTGVVHSAGTQMQEGITSAPVQGPLTGAPVGGNAVTTQPTTTGAALATTKLTAQQVIENAGKETGIDASKASSLARLYQKAAGQDGVLDKMEAQRFADSGLFKGLTDPQKKGVERALVLRHMAPEGSFTTTQ
jgi:hypothetical protein